MNIELFESIKVDIKKSYKENICFCTRDFISYQDKIPSLPIIKIYMNKHYMFSKIKKNNQRKTKTAKLLTGSY